MKIKIDKTLLIPLFFSLLMLQGTQAVAESSNLLTSAVAWKRTAAEFEALYYQGFNIARIQLDRALQNHKDTDRPLAIISDIDDTVLSSNRYWGCMVNSGKEFFDDDYWDKWIAENGPVVTPGALEFLNYAQSKGVSIFYVTSRDQGSNTLEYVLANLRKNKLPFADEEHVTVYRDSSNKEPRQKEIAKDYDVVVMLGDNLNDFKRKYYVNDVNRRKSLMTEDKEQFGRKFILFPNPTDGHWLAAIFGSSEPSDTLGSRYGFKAAASSTCRPPKTDKGTDITGIPDRFEYSDIHYSGGSKMTFDKNTNQMTYTTRLNVGDGKGTKTTSQTITIPPEKWAPFLQAVNAAGGKSLNGQSFADPNPPQDVGGWDMKINDTEFSVGWTNDPPLNIHKMLQNLTGLERF